MKKLIPILLLVILSLSCKKDDEDITKYDKDNELVGIWLEEETKTIWINTITEDTFNLYKDTTFTFTIDNIDSVFEVSPSPRKSGVDLTLNKKNEFFYNGDYFGIWSMDKNILEFVVNKPGYINSKISFYYNIRNSNQLEIFLSDRYFEAIGRIWKRLDLYIYKRKK